MESEGTLFTIQERAFGRDAVLMALFSARRRPSFESLRRPSLAPKPLIPPAVYLKKPQVALIIDDVGLLQEPVKQFLKLNAPLTFSVLPGGKYSRSQAEEAMQRGFEILLHLPLEPLDPKIDPGPGAIYSYFTPEEILQRLRRNLEAVPGVVGVSNHMGSKGTQDPKLMELIMKELKSEGLFFVDSKTIHTSIVSVVAVAKGVPVATRDLFIDHNGVKDIENQLKKLQEMAVRKGSAVGIAHARPGVAEAIGKFLPCFAAAGVEIVPVSKVVE